MYADLAMYNMAIYMESAEYPTLKGISDLLVGKEGQQWQGLTAPGLIGHACICLAPFAPGEEPGTGAIGSICVFCGGMFDLIPAVGTYLGWPLKQCGRLCQGI
jgi:hypothetical protein